MDKRVQSFSNKSFDYKLPLLRHKKGFSYSRLTPLKQKSIFDHLHRARAGFYFCSSSLSITGLTDQVKDHHQKKEQKKMSSTQSFFKNRFQVKKIPQVLTEIPDKLEDDLKGWEVS
jgi:hypothetical protein